MLVSSKANFSSYSVYIVFPQKYHHHWHCSTCTIYLRKTSNDYQIDIISKRRTRPHLCSCWNTTSTLMILAPKYLIDRQDVGYTNDLRRGVDITGRDDRRVNTQPNCVVRHYYNNAALITRPVLRGRRSAWIFISGANERRAAADLGSLIAEGVRRMLSERVPSKTCERDRTKTSGA